MRAIVTAVALVNASARADGSLGLKLTTPVLSSEEKAAMFDLQGLELVMLLQSKEDDKAQLTEVKAQFDEKTPSHRLRGCLFVWWQHECKQYPEQEVPFENFYRIKMDSLIEFVKRKLPSQTVH